MDQGISKGSKAEVQLKGEGGGSLVDFEGLLRGLSRRTPAGSRSRLLEARVVYPRRP